MLTGPATCGAELLPGDPESVVCDLTAGHEGPWHDGPAEDEDGNPNRCCWPVDGFLSETQALPRTWSVPAEPGPEVTAVRDREGTVWNRQPWPYLPNGAKGSGAFVWANTRERMRWRMLVHDHGPLTDATAEVQP